MMGKTVRKMRANIQFWPSYKLINFLKIVFKLHLNFDTSKLGQDFGSMIGVCVWRTKIEGRELKG